MIADKEINSLSTTIPCPEAEDKLLGKIKGILPFGMGDAAQEEGHNYTHSVNTDKPIYDQPFPYLKGSGHPDYVVGYAQGVQGKPEDYNAATGDSHGGHAHLSKLAAQSYAKADALDKPTKSRIYTDEDGKDRFNLRFELGWTEADAQLYTNGDLEMRVLAKREDDRRYAKHRSAPQTLEIKQNDVSPPDVYPQIRAKHLAALQKVSDTKSKNMAILVYRAHCLEKAVAHAITVIECNMDSPVDRANHVDRILKIGMGEA